MKRRAFLGTAAAATLAGCDTARPIEGGFTGADLQRGHALRDRLVRGDVPAPSVSRRTQVVVAGGGIAGLAAARALRQGGLDDFMLFELEDAAGGNSRAGSVGGIACPLGAHYLPVPGNDAREVQALLEELGLRRRVAGRWVYDEHHLAHSPQERLYFQGAWQDGLLPTEGVGEKTLTQYRRFAVRVAALQRTARFALPAWRAPRAAQHLALDAVTFAQWLDGEGLTDSHLRWYLDYCCRDDYGAGAAVVSAWAGVHYFASRHGFHAPGDGDDDGSRVLTWPEGNGWLAQRLAAPVGDRLRTGHSVLRIDATQRYGVAVDVLDHGTQRTERWLCAQCVVALPVLVASRVVADPPAVLVQAAARTRTAPWLVANIHLDAPLADRPGAAPAWDNVVYGAHTLGYVNARHQALDPTATVASATVLTWYHALGGVADGRRQLQEAPWTHWRDLAFTDLADAHPDLPRRTTRIACTRYGHAMAMPLPGNLGQISAQRPPALRGTLLKEEHGTVEHGRLHFAHADWSGYSVFEEAFTRGHLAGRAVAVTG